MLLSSLLRYLKYLNTKNPYISQFTNIHRYANYGEGRLDERRDN